VILFLPYLLFLKAYFQRHGFVDEHIEGKTNVGASTFAVSFFDLPF
jgi:hypothetical protein